MKTIGLIGGMSWESTAEYYRLINEGVKARLGGHHSARLVLVSVDFAEIELLQREARWEEAGRLLADAGLALERAGADFTVLCTNTMHVVAHSLVAALRGPLLHIADPTAEAVLAAGLTRVGLLGTRFTMEQAFYAGRLREQHGLEVLIPEAGDRELVHRVIYDELVHGRVLEASRQRFEALIGRLQARGAQGVILGCTELMLLVAPARLSLPCFDTTALHAARAVEVALG
jgi:aspartate racemase